MQTALQRQFLFFVICMTVVFPAWGQCKSIPMGALEQGIYELNLGDVRIKVETFNQIFKMKLIGAVNEDWTSVNMEHGAGMISGYVGNGSSARLKAQAVLKISDDGFTGAVFRKNSLDEEEGVGYFISQSGVKCIETTFAKWEDSRQKYIPAISAESAINLEPDGLL